MASADGFAKAIFRLNLSSTSTTVGSASIPGNKCVATSVASSDNELSGGLFLALMRFLRTIVQ